MKKIIFLLTCLFAITNIVYGQTKSTIFTPEFDDPNAVIFDLSKIKTKDNIMISDFTFETDFILSIYLYDGKEWILASRYTPRERDRKKIKEEFYSMSFQIAPGLAISSGSSGKSSEEKIEEEQSNMNAFRAYSYHDGSLSKFTHAAITVNKPSIYTDYGIYQSDLYFIVTKIPTPKTSKTNATLIQGNTIHSYYEIVDQKNDKRKRGSIGKTVILNISEQKDVLCKLYGFDEATDEFIFLGITYFNTIGQQNELIRYSKKFLNHTGFYLISDSSQHFEVEGFIKNSNLWFILK